KVEYLQIVESYRDNGKVRQKVICTLGRLDELRDSRQIDRLVEGLVRFSAQQGLLSLAQDSLFSEWSREVGPALVFRRLWENTGLARIISNRVQSTKIEFDVAEAVFAMVLNRLRNPSSKLQVSEWAKKDVYDPNFHNLELHHYYRALDFLAEHKNAIEEHLFFEGQDLFNQTVDLVFFDTTTSYFEGPTRATDLCKYGYSKDHRPDRVQVMIGLLIDQKGVPIAHEVLPGNTPDYLAFMETIQAVKTRFNLCRVVLVGDRGMANEKTIKAIEEAGYEYILGVKMRRGKEVQEHILTRPGRFKQVEDNLHVKNVVYEDNRYVICYNPEEAARDALTREKVLEKLEKKLREQGPKSLIGNKAYSRYLKVDKDQFRIDPNVAREEARYDGKYILRTNTTLPAEEVALAYKQLWMVEQAFREMKSNLELRPMYHWTDSRIRGHIMVCFLAFYLEMKFRKRLGEIAPEAHYQSVMDDLARMHATKLKVNGKETIIRNEITGEAHLAFKVARMQVPSRVLRA
ncbi:MAG: IS1634 family transposase, partial [Syntrophomonadaceae bacterium]|nr:IS1634 family transposase [Syntrophomonadaceae bacterium]